MQLSRFKVFSNYRKINQWDTKQNLETELHINKQLMYERSCIIYQGGKDGQLKKEY